MQAAPDMLGYKKNYDKELEDQVSRDLFNIIEALNYRFAVSRGNLVNDPILVASIKGIVQPIIRLFIHYKEFDEAKKLIEFSNWMRPQYSFNLQDILKSLETVNANLATVMGINHDFRDNVKTAKIPEKEIKKKLRLPEHFEEQYPEIELFYRAIHSRWKRIDFLFSAYQVMRKGAIQLLVTGINDSGKTHAAIAFCWQDNLFLRNFWGPYLKQHPIGELDGVYEDEAHTIPLHKFSMKNDISYLPATEESNEELGDLYFQQKDYNEGMLAAIRNRSQSKEVIDMGVTAYLTRSHRNFTAYEYQIADRPTGLLMGRFNVWLHKVSPEWGILSMPSSVYRKNDPLYLKELDKLRDDDAILKWLIYENPNFICWVPTPKLSAKKEKKFEKLQHLAHMKLKEQRQAKTRINDDYYSIVKQIWERINVKHDLMASELKDTLTSPPYNFNESNIRVFKHEYNKYDSVCKIVPHAEKLGIVLEEKK